MINSDLMLLALFAVTGLNILRYLSSLRSLIFVMREAHPLLYQQVDGGGFFTTHGNVSKQVRLFHYLKNGEFHHHHDPVFIEKCQKVRETFVLSVVLLVITLVASFIV